MNRNHRGGSKLKRHIGDFELGKRIGKGGQGKVFVARLRDDTEVTERAVPANSNVALKVIFHNKLDGKRWAMLDHEMEIMKTLHSCEFICKVYTYYRTANYRKSRSDTTLPACCILSELATGGPLHDYLALSGLPTNIGRHYVKKLMTAISYCHSQNIAHRDLMPDNILLDAETFNLKVVDFGMGKMIQEESLSSNVTHTQVGTEGYISPECNDRSFRTTHGYNPFKLDIWSCGCIIFSIFIGCCPVETTASRCWYYNKLKDKKYDSFWKGHMKFFPTLAILEDSDFRDLIQKMLSVNPEDRVITAAEVLEHPFLTKGSDISDDVLVGEMERRKATIHATLLEAAKKKGCTEDVYDPFAFDTKRGEEGEGGEGDGDGLLPQDINTDSTNPAESKSDDVVKGRTVLGEVLTLTTEEMESRRSDHFYDIYSALPFKSVRQSLLSAISEIGAALSADNTFVIAERGEETYKVKLVSKFSGDVLAFTYQIWAVGDDNDRRKTKYAISFVKREGTLHNFQSVYRKILDKVGHILTEIK